MPATLRAPRHPRLMSKGDKQAREQNVRATVRALVELQGVLRTAHELRVSRETVARVAGGLFVRPGTLLLVAERLGEREAAC